MLTQGGIASARFPDMLDVQDDTRFTGNDTLLDTSFPGFFRLPEVVIPFASSIALHPDKQPEAKMSVVARSTPRSIVETGDTVISSRSRSGSRRGPGPSSDRGAGRGDAQDGVPVRRQDGASRRRKEREDVAVFLVSSSGFLTNPFARAGNGTEMSQFGMNIPMGQDEQLLQLAGPYAQQGLTQTILAFKNTLDWILGRHRFPRRLGEDHPGPEPGLRRRLEAELRRQRERRAGPQARRGHEAGAQAHAGRRDVVSHARHPALLRALRRPPLAHARELARQRQPRLNIRTAFRKRQKSHGHFT